MIVGRIVAWCAHLYTALGLVAAAGIAVLIVRREPGDFRAAFVLIFVATAIDATDGSLARRARVREVTPSFDGRRLDDIIDFHTYTTLPLLLIWRSDVLPSHLAGWLLLPLLASAYGFSQTEAKTEDGFFLGFPSYWNVVAFYLYFLRPVPWVSLTVLVGLALLTFVPVKYLHPSLQGRLSWWTNFLGALWAGVLLLALVRDERPSDLVIVALFYPAYYMIASWAMSLHSLRQRRSRSRAPR